MHTFAYLTVSILFACNLLIFANERVNPVLVVSFDGLSKTYLNEYLNENPDSVFHEIIKNGVLSNNSYPSFPSSTFPNHYSLVTGLYPESHGIVGNTLYDPDLNRKINLQKDPDRFEPIWWNQAEPIWLKASKKGYKTASMFWCGSDVNGRQPDIWKKFNADVTYEERVNSAVEFISKNKTKLTFLYFEQPDVAGHKYGPESFEYKNKIKVANNITELLIKELKRVNVYDNLNIIIVSDHGMVQLKNDPTIIFEKVLNQSIFELIDQTKTVFGVVSHVWTKSESDILTVYDALKQIGNMSVYLKNEVPQEFNFRNNKRIGPIVVITDEGYVTALDKPTVRKGYHGYNNTIESMKGIFMAIGPDFKTNETIEKSNNVDVYPLLCYLLKIEPNPNNGSLESFKNILQPRKDLATINIEKKDLINILKEMKSYFIKHKKEFCMVICTNLLSEKSEQELCESYCIKLVTIIESNINEKFLINSLLSFIFE